LGERTLVSLYCFFIELKRMTSVLSVVVSFDET